MFKVYMHVNKINHKKYVGITKQKPQTRWRNGYGYDYKGSKFNKAIKKYGWDNFEHFILCDNLTEKEAKDLEVFFIKKFDSYNNGYNGTLGGDFVSLGNHNKLGKKLTNEQRKKISESHKGKTSWIKGKHHTDETKIKMAKPVIQYDLNGNFVAEYFGLNEAQRKTGIQQKDITLVCQGKRQTAKGYIWQYAN